MRRICSMLAAVAIALPATSLAQTGVSPATPAAHATPADMAFMHGMIGHHEQALAMCRLVAERAAHPQLPLLAERIAVSQQDEIALMRRWLEQRGLAVPPAAGHTPASHGAHANAAHANSAPAHATPAHAMPGMLTSAQLDSLAGARGAAFDRLFLQYMIQHHEGALIMVAQLLASANAARDPMVFQFASDVDTDQRAEIRRMRALLDAR